MQSTTIRSRLLENTSEKSMILQAVFNYTRSIDIAQRSSESYNTFSTKLPDFSSSVSATTTDLEMKSAKEGYQKNSVESADVCSMHTFQKKCGFCGNNFHARTMCPAKRSKCYNCGNFGHFAKQCRSRTKSINFSSNSDVAVMKAVNGAPDKVNVKISVNGVDANALIDTGSTLSHINKSFALKHKFNVRGERNGIGLAVTENCSQSDGCCLSTICLQNRNYLDTELLILGDLLTDVILGQDILKLRNHVRIEFGSPQPALTINALECMKTDKISRLFEYLKSDC